MSAKMEQKMPSAAKAYITVIAAAAAATLVAVVPQWNSANVKSFMLFFALAMLSSAMKIRLPGFKTTISMNFVFVLIGIALLGFAETTVIGLGGALVQSLWKTQTRPKPVQVLFNTACLTVCTAAAFWTSHNALAMLGLHSMAAMMVIAACVYVALNTGMVSMVISLAEGRPLTELWSSCYEWTFPYFLVGAAVAGLASVAADATNLGVTLLVMPVVYFVYIYYRMHMFRVVLETISSLSHEDHVVLTGTSSNS